MAFDVIVMNPFIIDNSFKLLSFGCALALKCSGLAQGNPFELKEIRSDLE